MKTTLNITPSPRVLRMLGQIDFAPWQCLAELIDNSIDAFIDSSNAGSAIEDPRVRITLPSDQQLRSGFGVMSVSDNGPGMTLDQLESAVKAGYSGNDPVEKMGLFGMGFNISTARLGRRTEVWTTQVDSPQWVGVVIDFDELEKNSTFEAPIVRRDKTEDELAENTHGTEVRVSKLDGNRTRPLIWGAGKAQTKKRLGKVYGRVMAKLGVTKIFDGDRINPWRHCVWSEARTVPTAEFGNVPAQIKIDHELPERKFCSTCWVWLTPTDENCPACGHNENLINRRRRLTGWIGVQRYFDKTHYGFDLIRNGRVIENLDKSLFNFVNAQGEESLEYPLDATHWGGRIVGELEIDFVRVTHQKDSFDKLDSEWKHVVELIRGTSPLRPKIAERLGLPRNTSHLARLYAGYRAGHAGLKELVPGDEQGEGINAGIIREWVDRFYAGEEDYQSDEKWYALVLQAERVKRGETVISDTTGGEMPIDNEDDEPEEGESSSNHTEDANNGDDTGPRVTQHVLHDDFLGRVYELPFGRDTIALTARVRKVTPLDEGRSYKVEASGYVFNFDYDPAAPLFEESLLSPLDLFLTDLAQHFLAVSAETPRNRPVSKIQSELRSKYFADTLSDISIVAESASSVFGELREHLCDALPIKAPIQLDVLDQHAIDDIKRRALRAELADEESVKQLIERGEFAKYASNASLIKLVEKFPDVVLDGSFLSPPYSGVSETLRGESLLMVLGGLEDTRWLAEEGSGIGSHDNAWRLRFNRAVASMRLLKSWQT